MIPVETSPIAKLTIDDRDQHDVHRIAELADRDRPQRRRRFTRDLVRPVLREPDAPASSPVNPELGSVPNDAATSAASHEKGGGDVTAAAGSASSCFASTIETLPSANSRHHRRRRNRPTSSPVPAGDAGGHARLVVPWRRRRGVTHPRRRVRPPLPRGDRGLTHGDTPVWHDGGNSYVSGRSPGGSGLMP